MTIGFSNSDKDGKSNILDIPLPTKESKQRSIGQEDLYMTRFVTPWSRPTTTNAKLWRWWIYNEPIAMICRETLTANVLALDWEITPRNSEDRDELKPVIRHYTKMLERGGNYYDYDWTGFVEWIMSDLQDLPFGAGAEIGRRYDSPTAAVLWVKPLDGGTLYPTLNKDYPVIQYYNNYDVVTFPKHAIARTYMSPRPELPQEGWGVAPPEKVYLALLLLYRGDKYYADLLLDTPPAGILDLGDMEMDSALNWIKAMQNFLLGSPSSFKVPVLYEHTTKTEFIPFGKVPNDIMFDRITLKYAAIVAAAYGMSLSDIGLQTTSASGETLAGSIRQERRTKRTGFARAKKKIKYFIESFLPDTLQFNFIDLDDELNVALGRARLATITALSAAQDKGVISADEHRLILLGDGLFGSTTLPEKPPADAVEKDNKSFERPGALGSPQPPSSGGEGEVKKMKSVHAGNMPNLDSHLKRFVNDIVTLIGKDLMDSVKGLNEDELYNVRSLVDDSIFSEEDTLGILEVIKSIWQGKRWLKLDFDEDFPEEFASMAEKSVTEYLEALNRYEYENGVIDDLTAWKELAIQAQEKMKLLDWKKLSASIQTDINEKIKLFIGKSAVYIMKDLLLSYENVFDTENVVSYDSIIDKISLSLQENFAEYVSTCVGLEMENVLETIKKEVI